MQGDLDGITCHICIELGHYQIDIPKYDPNCAKNNNRKQSARKGQGGGGGGSKWCSLHRSMTHSVAEFEAQQQANVASTPMSPACSTRAN